MISLTGSGMKPNYARVAQPYMPSNRAPTLAPLRARGQGESKSFSFDMSDLLARLVGIPVETPNLAVQGDLVIPAFGIGRAAP